MSARTQRGNRVGLALTALALGGAGGYALWRSDDRGPVLSEDLRADVAREDRLWLAVAAVAVVVALLCLRWLLVQRRRPGLRRLPLEDRTTTGSTVLQAEAVTDAVEAAAEDVPGVTSASAALVRRRRGLQLHLRLGVTRDVDVERLTDHLTATLLPDARSALEEPQLPLVVRLRTGSARATAPRVV